MDELYDECRELVEQVARKWSLETPGIDREDIEQELWLFLVENYEQIKRDAEDIGRLTNKALNERAKRYCAGERYDYTFHSAQYVYTPAEVRALLKEAFFDPASRESMPSKASQSVTLMADGVAVALWDMEAAFDNLTDIQRNTVRKWYERGEEPTETEQRRVRRAVDAMTRFLNQRVAARQDEGHDGPGSRRAISNAHAMAITGRDY